MESWRGDQCRAWVGFNISIAHRITAGCDILLMPSRFEPCGLNQLYAMAYGTVPVVHAVGGLRDTVVRPLAPSSPAPNRHPAPPSTTEPAAAGASEILLPRFGSVEQLTVCQRVECRWVENMRARNGAATACDRTPAGWATCLPAAAALPRQRLPSLCLQRMSWQRRLLQGMHLAGRDGVGGWVGEVWVRGRPRSRRSTRTKIPGLGGPSTTRTAAPSARQCTTLCTRTGRPCLPFDGCSAPQICIEASLA